MGGDVHEKLVARFVCDGVSVCVCVTRVTLNGPFDLGLADTVQLTFSEFYGRRVHERARARACVVLC